MKYAELDERAQATAREWMRECLQRDWEPGLDYYVRVLGYLGFGVSTQTQQWYSTHQKKEVSRTRSAIHYSLGYCQGDYANFEGDWHGNNMDVAKLHEELPEASDLHAAGAQLLALWLRHQGIYALVGGDDGAFGVYYDGYDDTDEEEYNEAWRVQTELDDALRTVNSWLYHELRSDYEGSTDDEACVDCIEANDYEFDEDGELV